MAGSYVCDFSDMALGCDIAAAGAKYVASWLAGNPPLEFLWISSEWYAWALGEDVWMTNFALRQPTLTLATTG